MVEDQLLLQLIQRELTGFFALLVASHSVGDQQVEEAVLGTVHGEIRPVVPQEQSVHGERVLVVFTHAAPVAERLNG